MRTKGKFRMALTAVALGLLLGAGTAHAATVDLQGLTTVTPSQGTFFFDVKISDVGSLSDWDSWTLSVVMDGAAASAKMVDFRTVTSNTNYVFFGDSAGYVSGITSAGSIAIATDATSSETGVDAMVDNLLARVTVDVSDTRAGETYAFSLPEAANFFTNAAGDTERFTQLQPDYSVQVVPIPAAAWLFGSSLLGLVGFARRKKAAK